MVCTQTRAEVRVTFPTDVEAANHGVSLSPQAGSSEPSGPAFDKKVGRTLGTHKALEAKATAVRAAFKRPAYWALLFGWSLGLCAGLVNVVAYSSFGVYVSHATGTTTAIGLRIEGYHTGRHDFEPLSKALALLSSFLAGAFLCGLLIDKNQVHFGGKALYGVALIGNAILLVLSVLAFPNFSGAMLAACACGLQNAMCTSHFGAVVRTTHVSGTITDIGSTCGRMAMIFLRNGCWRSRLNVLERAEVGVDARKLLVLGPMWIFFLLGTILGAYLESALGIYAMLVPASVTFTFGCFYTFFRQNFKVYIKKSMKDRLSHDLEDVEHSLERTHLHLQSLRGRQDATRRAADMEKNPGFEFNFDDLESEMDHIRETIHQVEADIEDIEDEEVTSQCSGYASSYTLDARNPRVTSNISDGSAEGQLSV